MLPPSRILGRSDAVTIMNTSALKVPVGIPCPLGTKTYDSEGKLLGILRDLSVEDITGKVIALHIDDTTYDPALLLRASKHGVIMRSPAHSELRVKRAPTKAPTHRPRRQPPQEGPAVEEALLPPADTLFHGEYAFLVGRTVSKDLVADGELLA